MNDFSNLANKIANDLNIATQVVSNLSEHKIVSIFGSARTPSNHQFYIDIKEIAYQLGKHGFTICTGGGPGIMQAASEGGKQSGATTIGLSIELPHEQKPNEFLDYNIDFKNFAQRKIVFCAISNAYIVGPGGFGSLDELFEMLTLMQCEITEKVPVILYGKNYWRPLMEFLTQSLLNEKMITQEDIDMIHVVDDVKEAVWHITNHFKEN